MDTLSRDCNECAIADQADADASASAGIGRVQVAINLWIANAIVAIATKNPPKRGVRHC